jgi:hypothetical protein
LEDRLANSDFDGDGFTPAQNDCDDTDPGIHPNAPDLASEPDGIDNDCDGEVDNDYTPPDPDNDGDGYPQSVDCDDNNEFVYPNNPNWYPDDRDHNCDYQVELQTPLAIIYYDAVLTVSCEVTQAGFATDIDVPCGQTGPYVDAGVTGDGSSNQDCRDDIVNVWATSRTQMCR